MTRKLPPQDDDDALARAVRSSAQQIWQAGLGAFAKAQGETDASSGTPAASEVEALRRRVDELEARLAELSTRAGAPKKPKKAAKDPNAGGA
jgi:ubiquinone biosynthesis protein UbiJ